MCIITDCEAAFHLKPLPIYRRSILYAGNDLALLKRLRESLRDCQTVRAPDGSVARLFIRNINYSLLLFDRKLPDTTGTELAEFTRAVPNRVQTPIILRPASEGEGGIVKTIVRLLGTGEARGQP